MDIYNIISEISSPFLNNIFNLITSSYFLIPIIVAVILILEEKKIGTFNLKSITLFILPIFLALILTVITTTAIKDVVHEDRPCHVIQEVKFPYCKHSSSFPSRHTAIAFTALPFLALRLRKYFVILLIYASLVGIGMIYLGQHYPHDVLAGFIIGFGIGYLFFLKNEWISEKCGKILKI